MKAKFCPFCQRKNKNEAIRCEHCGVLLISSKPSTHTTVGIGDMPAQAKAEVIPCVKRLDNLPENSFALFIKDFKEPFIIPIKPTVILGRDNDDSEDYLVDLSRFEDITMGVSRQHAAIYYSKEDGFTLEDLDSTNGTWLNRRRVMPREKHTLVSDDQIWLGPLKMLFCLGSNKPPQPATFWLQHIKSSKSLSPQILINQIGPYLQSIIEIDHIRSAAQATPENKISIISLTQVNDLIEVELNHATDILNFLHPLLKSWRQENSSAIEDAKPTELTKQKVGSLALQVVELIAPDLNPEEKAAQAEMFFSPLLLLTASPLNLIIDVSLN